MNITFRKATKEDTLQFVQSFEQPYLRALWPLESYGSTPQKYIEELVAGNGYDYPFIIELGGKPIGYIQYCDLFAYRNTCEKLKGVFTKEPKGSFCVDMFIGEEGLLGKGYGTQALRLFCDELLTRLEVKRILIDPAADNERAIRSYEKAGFKRVRQAFDGVCQVQIMEMRSASSL